MAATATATATVVLLSVLCGFAGNVRGQPFMFNGTFAPGLQEAEQRQSVNYTGFVFNFAGAKKTDGGTPNSSLRSNQVGQNPFLSTLPAPASAGQTLVTMGPCAGNTVHTHPRGSEISFVTYGQVLFGMIEENNAKGNYPVIRTMEAGQTIHIPQGLLHFSHNPTCGHAQFIANFAQPDPGTQTTWNSFIATPGAVLQMSTGISEDTWAQYKQLPRPIAPGTGGEECLKKCGLNYTAENAFEPSADDASAMMSMSM